MLPWPKENAQIIASIVSLSETADAHHAEMRERLHRVKTDQQQLEQNVPDITSRLAVVESLVKSLDAPQHVAVIDKVVSEAVRGATAVRN